MQLPMVWSTLALGLILLPHAWAADSTCPDGSLPNKAHGQSICCPGIQDLQACLVGCKLGQPSCFPFCHGSTPNKLTTVGTCTTVSFGDPDYTNKAYASRSASGTGPVTINPEASSSGESGATAANTGAMSMSTGAAAVVTDPPMLVVAGAFAAYALF